MGAGARLPPATQDDPLPLLVLPTGEYVDVNAVFDEIEGETT